MTRYAKIENNLVAKVILAEDDFISSLEGIWIKVTENTNSAGIGYSYDSDRNKFVSPKPFDSWTLDTETNQWKSPVESPGNNYYWNEDNTEWTLRPPKED